jgi:hypothetical protein
MPSAAPQPSEWIVPFESYHVESWFDFVWVRVMHDIRWRVQVNLTAVLAIPVVRVQVRVDCEHNYRAILLQRPGIAMQDQSEEVQLLVRKPYALNSYWKDGMLEPKFREKIHLQKCKKKVPNDLSVKGRIRIGKLN